MVGINEHFLLGLVFRVLMSSLVRSDTPILNLCHEGNVTSNLTDLNMNTSLIAGTNGYCSCLITLQENTLFDIYTKNVVSPGCDTVIQLTDNVFNASCPYNDSQLFHTNYFKATTQLCIYVIALGNSQELISGTLAMGTNGNPTFNLKCNEADLTSSAVKTPTLTNTCTTSEMIFLPTTEVPTSVSTETKGNGESTHPNKTADKKMDIPVALISGCTVGGVAIVMLIIVVVMIYRRKKANQDHEAPMKHDDATVKTEDSRSRNNDYTDIENELYCPSDDLAMSSEISLNDNAASQIAEETNNAVSPNGDIYAIVKKSRNITDPPQSSLNRETAPSGD